MRKSKGLLFDSDSIASELKLPSNTVASHNRLSWLKEVMSTEKKLDPVAVRTWARIKQESPLVPPLDWMATHKQARRYLDAPIEETQLSRLSTPV